MAAQSVTTPTATHELLLALSKVVSGDSTGPCEVCGHESQRLVEPFPAPDDAPLIPDDRVVCGQCLALGIIAVKVGATATDIGRWRGAVE